MRDRTSITRRARILLVFAAGAALVLPGSAVANHGECTGIGSCPEFTPDQEAGTSYLYTDTPSSLFFRNYQADHEMPIVDLAYYLPDGWQLALASLREAAKDDGVTPATSCNDLYSGDFIPKNLGNAEALASTVGARIRYEGPDFFGGFSRHEGDLGLNPGNSPNLVFMDWNGTAGTHDGIAHDGMATLCMYWANPGVGSDFFGNETEELPPDAREFIIPVYAYKLPVAHAFGWKIDFDIATVTRNAGLKSRDASMIHSNFMISGTSSGNWNTNPVLGNLEAIDISRTPATPGDYVLRSELTGCRDGFNALPAADACKSANTITRVFEQNLRITPAPNSAFHDFAILTGPGSRVPGTNGGELWGTSLVRSPGGTVEVPFNQPVVAPGEKIKAYALALASAGDFNNVHWEYAIVDATHGDFSDPSNEKVCGASGTDAACKFVLQFPLNAGSKVLPPDGTYDLALVTIYSDGHRTDKGPKGQPLCDNETGPGALCSAANAGFVVNDPGIGQWEFMLRREAWPVAYNTTKPGPNGFEAGIDIPQYVLLVDFDTHRAEFNIWHHKGPTKTYAGSNASTINGDNGGKVGLVSFGSSEIGGTSERFQFAGLIDEPLGFPANAYGQLITYNLRGQPFAGPGADLPSFSMTEFSSFNPSF